MGQTAEEYDDGQVIAEHLMENILSEVTRSINERKDFCFDSFESLKLQTFGSEDILEFGCLKRENFVKTKEFDSQESCNTNPNADVVCYPSLANLPEVCIHSSSLINTSKQGEGDFQHALIRETVAFHRLEAAEEEKESRPSGSKDCHAFNTDEETCNNEQVQESHKNEEFENVQVEPERLENHFLMSGSKDCLSCDSSLISATSCNELIEDLQRNINNLSFDDVHMSESEEDGSRSQSQGRSAGSSTPLGPRSRDGDACVSVLDDQDETQQDPLVGRPYLQQSKKFWHPFPCGAVPANYCQLVNKSYDNCELMAQEEDELELLSNGSSEDELVIIESEEVERLMEANLYENGNRDCLSDPVHQPVDSQRTIVDGGCRIVDANSGHCFWESSRPFNAVTVVADVHEQAKGHRNWEESLEVEVNVTEPVKDSGLEEEGEEELDEDRVKFRQYMTSVGLVTEKTVNPKYAAFMADDTDGIESIPGVPRVTEMVITRSPRNSNRGTLESEEDSEREITTSSHTRRIYGVNCRKELKKDENEVGHQSCAVEELELPGVNQSDDNKLNYLNFPNKSSGNVKKKNKLVARITRSFTNLFRSKKKNPKP